MSVSQTNEAACDRGTSPLNPASTREKAAAANTKRFFMFNKAINRPPIVRKGNQMSNTEAKTKRSIAGALLLDQLCLISRCAGR
jgi:hypothetical protein